MIIIKVISRNAIMISLSIALPNLLNIGLIGNLTYPTHVQLKARAMFCQHFAMDNGVRLSCPYHHQLPMDQTLKYTFALLELGLYRLGSSSLWWPNLHEKERRLIPQVSLSDGQVEETNVFSFAMLKLIML